MGAGCRGCEAPSQSDCAKRSQLGLVGRGTGRTRCAKRTQFPEVEVTHRSTIPSFQYSNPMQIVRNKPNWGNGKANGK